MVKKKRQVAEKRPSNGFDKGGLQIQHPQEIEDAYISKMLHGHFSGQQHKICITTVQYLKQAMLQESTPGLEDHANFMGPMGWIKMGRRLMVRNKIIGLAFQSVAALLIKLKCSPDHWRFVPIGNTVYLSPQTVSEGHT